MNCDLSELQKGIVYFSLCYCYEYGGNRELYNKYGIEGAQYALSHPGCGIRSTIRLMTLACQIETQLGNQEAAGAWLNKLESIRQGRNFLIETAQYSITAATYEMTFGNLEKAYDHYQTAITQADILWEKDTSYYLILGQMAVILQRLNRFQEAVEQYQRLLNYAEESDNAHLLHIFSNNISVAYLEMAQPDNALRHLQTALIQARESGGIALAEVQRNRARAFGQLGDYTQEYTCLKEAFPLLTAAYGPDHPRTAAARDRLAQIEQGAE